MIAILLAISLLQLTTADILKQPDSTLLGLDDSLVAILYDDVPDYEDPQLFEYELSKFEDHPIVSLTHLEKKHVHNKNTHVLSKEAIANFKLQLDSVVTRLQTVQARLDKGSTDVPVEDIEKSIQDLKTLEHIVQSNNDQLMSAMHQGLLRSEQHPLGKLLNVRSRHTPAVGVSTIESVIYELRPLTTKAPFHEKKQLAINLQVHEMKSHSTKPRVYEIESFASKPPVYESESLVTKSPVYEIKPLVAEGPVFAIPPLPTEAPKDTSEVEEIRVPFKDEVFKSEGIKERYEMNPYHSRWT